MLIEVAVPVPLFKTFTYKLPSHFEGIAKIGSRVVVPFGFKSFTGIITSLSGNPDIPKIKNISDLLDTDEPTFSPSMIRFADWLSSYYISPLGETLRTMLPQGMASDSNQRVFLNKGLDLENIIAELRKTAPRQSAILTALSDHKDGILISTLRKAVGSENLFSQLEALEKKELIIKEKSSKKVVESKTQFAVKLSYSYLNDETKLRDLLDELDEKAPKQSDLILALLYENEMNAGENILLSKLLETTNLSASVAKALHTKGVIDIFETEVSREEILLPKNININSTEANLTPNIEQALAINQINSSVDKNIFDCFLLHGITGSGKTLVYIEAIKNCIKSGKTALLLVPEIAITIHLVERFTSVFGKRVVVLHSRMSEGERYDSWRRAKENGCDLVIGARSALFAPLKNIGIVIVDEEHESSFKQYDQQPRYHARDAAVVRANFENAVAILGSATPSVESFYNAQIGKYKLLQLNQRADNATEPQMILVDVAKAKKENRMQGSISKTLLELINQKIEKKEGTILFQNRRGFATRIECSDCSHTPMCPNCAVALTYHKPVDELRCHYCNYFRTLERSCSVCGGKELRQPGVGTQKVEEELKTFIQDVRLLRMDLDTTTKKGSHKFILNSFAKGEADILLGTQMVAKGLDFSRVSLVGIVSADSQLNLPDFRASERTYQLITQVAGRAGRRSGLEGDVVIQTCNINHPAIQASFTKDYLAMYNFEIQTRKELQYPPYSRFVLIEIRSEDKSEAENHADIFRRLLPTNNPIMQVLGPAPALIWKLRNQYRFQIFVKNIKHLDPAGKKFKEIFVNALETYNQKHAKKSVQLIIDIDSMGS